MRKPACSIMALIAPVRLRAVASGLMIENVRSIAIWQASFVGGLRPGKTGAAYNDGPYQPQGHECRMNAAVRAVHLVKQQRNPSLSPCSARHGEDRLQLPLGS